MLAQNANVTLLLKETWGCSDLWFHQESEALGEKEVLLDISLYRFHLLPFYLIVETEEWPKGLSSPWEPLYYGIISPVAQLIKVWY